MATPDASTLTDADLQRICAEFDGEPVDTNIAPLLAGVIRPAIAGDYAVARSALTAWSQLVGGIDHYSDADCRHAYDGLRAAAARLGYAVQGEGPQGPPIGWGVWVHGLDVWLTQSVGLHPGVIVFSGEDAAKEVAAGLSRGHEARSFGPLDDGERAELERLRKALPKTADGVAIVPGMRLHAPFVSTGGKVLDPYSLSPITGFNTDGQGRLAAIYWQGGFVGVGRGDKFYSSREAAIAANPAEFAGGRQVLPKPASLPR